MEFQKIFYLLPFLVIRFELLKSIRTEYIAHADHKIEAFIGKFLAGLLQFLELVFDFSVVDFFFAQELIQFKLFALNFRFKLDQLEAAVGKKFVQLTDFILAQLQILLNLGIIPPFASGPFFERG